MIRLLSCVFLTASFGSLFAQAPPEHAATNSGITTPQGDRQSAAAHTVNYSPLSGSQKFIRHTQDVFYPVPLVGVGLGAALAQAINSPKEWGGGARAYGLRYASVFGTSFVHEYLAFGMESVLKEDPRYFPSTDRSVKGRLKNALKQVVIARKDNGSETFAYSRVGSALGAGLIANAWQPHSTSDVGHGFGRGAILLGIDSGLNLAQEFIPFLRHLNHQ